MKKFLLILPLLLLFAVCSQAQLGNVFLHQFPGAPTGSCASALQTAINTSNGDFYDCVNGAWNKISGSGGGFTAGGDLSGTSSSQEVVGVLSNALPSLSTGFLNWTGLVWAFSSALSNPMTTLGDILYGGASGAATRLAGPTSAGTYVVTEKPASGAAAAETFNLAGVVPNPQTGTTYTYLQTDSTADRAGYTTFSNASAIAVTLPQAGSTGFGSNWVNKSCNIGAGTVTITPTTSTVSYTTGGAYVSAGSSVTLVTGQCIWLYSDNTNYFANREGGNATSTNCAGAGTAASPSVASCSAAPSGAFSCAPNASTATCVIDTTAVTANSNIFIQPTAAAGTRLSVTCNTSSDTGVTAPRLASISAGTSFTINLGTFSTNPECFDYWVVN